jgi:hypothetical protein
MSWSRDVSTIEQTERPGPGSLLSASLSNAKSKESKMLTILVVIAVLMLLGVLPTWPHSRTWGYGPSSGVGLVVLVLLVLLLSGRL